MQYIESLEIDNRWVILGEGNTTDRTEDITTYESNELNFQAIQSLNPLFARELIHRFLIHHKQIEVTRANINDIYKMVMKNLGNWEIQLKRNHVVYGKSKKIKILIKQTRSMP